MPRVTEQLENRQVAVALERRDWEAVRVAALAAHRKDPGRFRIVPEFLTLLDGRVRAYSAPGINAPGNLGSWSNSEAIPVIGRLCNWSTILDACWLSADEKCRTAGAVITAACSAVMHSKTVVTVEDLD